MYLHNALIIREVKYENGNLFIQIIYVKTTNDDILLLKVIGKNNNQHKNYNVKVLEKNGELMDEDSVIYNEEITRTCIVPSEIQQGIELTISHVPTFNLNGSKNLPSDVEFGERQEND